MVKNLGPEHYRYGLLAANLILTAMVAWGGLWAFGFHKALWAAGVIDESSLNRPKDFAFVKDLDEYRIRGGESEPRKPERVAPVVDTFEPAPPPPVAPESTKTDPVAEADEIVDDGPLADKWELSGVATLDSGPVAFISEKQADPRRGRGGSAFQPRPAQPGVTTAVGPNRPYIPPRGGTSRRQKMVTVNDPRNPGPYTIDNDGDRQTDVRFFVRDIRVDEGALVLAYAVEGNEKRYHLTKERKGQGPDIRGESEEEAPATPPRPGMPPSTNEQGKIVSGDRTFGPKETPSASTAAGGPGAAAAGKLPAGGTGGKAKWSPSPAPPPPSGGGPRPPTRDEVNQLKEAVKDIPPEARKQINDAVRGKVQR